LVRTFQINQLFASMTPLQTLAMVVSQQRGLGGRWWQKLGQDAAVVERCEQLLSLFRLTVVMHQRTEHLAYGKRRLLEMAIALACDIRIAAQSAFVSAGYARVGLSGDYGVAWLLTRAVGSPIARELMFTSDRVDSARAERIGLFNRVVPDEQLRDAAFAMARTMANGPAVALRHMKDNLDDVPQINFDTALEREAHRLVSSSQTEDHREAVRAFIEKRPPVFKGR
jgi:hypothetical protein